MIPHGSEGQRPSRGRGQPALSIAEWVPTQNNPWGGRAGKSAPAFHREQKESQRPDQGAGFPKIPGVEG